ncbi:hypothetical protein E3U43_004863 [Larimichthys crocea]|uniref:Uncharacterized protein n=1 Tax=Larimichthys crocea TaxID=215358 RepID=A0ACD3QEQ0_LARCR|nr:hypothetical protein E3U43_004863 [Larimichthys crocea]
MNRVMLLWEETEASQGEALETENICLTCDTDGGKSCSCCKEKRFLEECETGAAEALKFRFPCCLRQLCPIQEPVPQENIRVGVRRWDCPLRLTLPWVTGDSMIWLVPSLPHHRCNHLPVNCAILSPLPFTAA